MTDNLFSSWSPSSVKQPTCFPPIVIGVLSALHSPSRQKKSAHSKRVKVCVFGSQCVWKRIFQRQADSWHSQKGVSRKAGGIWRHRNGEELSIWIHERRQCLNSSISSCRLTENSPSQLLAPCTDRKLIAFSPPSPSGRAIRWCVIPISPLGALQRLLFHIHGFGLGIYVLEIAKMPKSLPGPTLFYPLNQG